MKNGTDANEKIHGYIYINKRLELHSVSTKNLVTEDDKKEKWNAMQLN